MTVTEHAARVDQVLEYHGVSFVLPYLDFSVLELRVLTMEDCM